MPVGQVVKERVPPWEEDNVLVVPVYEEQLVVVKRLLLREHLRIRRVPAMESQLFEDTVRRERVTIEYPEDTGLVREQFPTVEEGSRRSADGPGGEEEAAEREEGGVLEKLGRKLIE